MIGTVAKKTLTVARKPWHKLYTYILLKYGTYGR